MADARSRAAVEQCHASLEDLQRSCAAAKAHKQVCSALLEAAHEAVEALEALLVAAGSEATRGRSLQQLAVRAQGALDQVRFPSLAELAVFSWNRKYCSTTNSQARVGAFVGASLHAALPATSCQA